MLNGKVLDDYQDDFITKLSSALRDKRSVIGQSPTGSGKAVVLSTVSYRFIQKSDKDVIIFVHKDELLNQTRTTLLEWYGIISQKIDRYTTIIQSEARVFVAMVETFDRRSDASSFLDNFKNVGLLIIDEAHLGNFSKIIEHFPIAKRIGFTATPIAAKKKYPLKDFYQDIVIGPSIQELVAFNAINPNRGVVNCRTYSFPKIDRASLKRKGEEIDHDAAGEEFAKKEQIQNTLEHYLRKSYGKKTIVFNSSVKHSIKMHEAFLAEGLNSRHLDGTKSGKYGNDAYRKDCFKWLHETPNAILNNVGIATTGFDEKSIETIIVNKSTLSLPLWNQMCGRGARPYQYPDGHFKDSFLVLDMGDNAQSGKFGEWSSPLIDWREAFWNPKTFKGGIAVMKTCPNCGALTYASARICEALRYDFLLDEDVYCGHIFPVEGKEQDTVFREMVLMGTKDIDVKATIEYFKSGSEFRSMFELVKDIAHKYAELGTCYLDSENILGICEAVHIKVSEWFKEKEKKRWPEFRLKMFGHVVKALKDEGFLITPEEELETQELIKSK